ncbi:hypothetical protein [Aeromonas veronii]|uniref:hypothetical protein n=1 Tax=Aeromonas veronii TaxID=654 RepID=UPI0030D3F453
MNSILPWWITDTAAILSIVGFIVTCFLLWEARKIRNSFMRKARIPEIVKDLDEISKELFSHLKSFSQENRNALQKIQNAKGLLESVLPKMDSGHQKKINEFVSLAGTADADTLTEDLCWGVYSQLSGLVTYFKQLEKDSKWEQ